MPGFSIPYIGLLQGKCDTTRITPSGPINTQDFARQHRYVLEILSPLSGNFTPPGILNGSQSSSQSNGTSVTSSSSNSLIYLNKANRPIVELDVITIHNGADTIPRPGKVVYTPVDFTFYESIDTATGKSYVTSAIYDWWSKVVYDISRSRLAAPSLLYTHTARLSLLDGAGDPIWSYELFECWPSKVTPSSLAYAENEISEIAVTLQYSKLRELSDRTTAPNYARL